MKNEILLFYMVSYLVSIEMRVTVDLDRNLNVSSRTTEEQEDDERWSWGFVDIILKNENITTETSITERYVLGEVDCNTAPEPMPDFNKPGRRISEIKCDEYIWYNKDRESRRKKKKACFSDRVPIISGGIDAKPGEYPHMCALGWKAVVGTWIFKCGGSLISANFVLTAAHCTQASSLDSSIADVIPKIIRFGDKNIIDSTSGFHPVDANIKRMIVHPQYKSPKKYYDIALIEVDFKFTFGPMLQPACLWTKFDTSALGNKANVTGWGVIESGTLKTRPVLQKAEVDLINSEACDQLLRPNCNRHWCGIKETQICAGVLIGGIDACQGDSGGPLQVKINLPRNEEGAMHYLLGVTSFGFQCSHKDTPGIYTRVSAFVDWIESIVWEKK